MSNKYKSRFNVAPCDYICRELSFYGWKKKVLGEKLGISQAEVEAVMQKQQPISKKMAASLEKVFGEPAMFWLSIDEMYWRRFEEETAAKVTLYKKGQEKSRE